MKLSKPKIIIIISLIILLIAGVVTIRRSAKVQVWLLGYAFKLFNLDIKLTYSKSEILPGYIYLEYLVASYNSEKLKILLTSDTLEIDYKSLNPPVINNLRIVNPKINIKTKQLEPAEKKKRKPIELPVLSVEKLEILNGILQLDNKKIDKIFFTGDISSSAFSATSSLENFTAILPNGYTILTKGDFNFKRNFIFYSGHLKLPISDFSIEIDSLNLSPMSFHQIKIDGGIVDFDEINELLGHTILKGIGACNLTLLSKRNGDFNGEFIYSGDIYGFPLSLEGRFNYNGKTKKGLVEAKNGIIWDAEFSKVNFNFDLASDTLLFNGEIANLKQIDLNKFSMKGIHFTGDVKYNVKIANTIILNLVSGNSTLDVFDYSIENPELDVTVQIKNKVVNFAGNINYLDNFINAIGVTSPDSIIISADVDFRKPAEVAKVLGLDYELNGNVIGQLDIEGKPGNMELSLSFNSDMFGFQDTKAEKVFLLASGDIRNGKPYVLFTCSAEKVNASDINIDSVQIIGEMNDNVFNLNEVNLFSDETNASLSAQYYIDLKTLELDKLTVFSQIVDAYLLQPIYISFENGFSFSPIHISIGDGIVNLDTLWIEGNNLIVSGSTKQLEISDFQPIQDFVSGSVISNFILNIDLKSFQGIGHLTGKIINPRTLDVGWDSAGFRILLDKSDLRIDALKLCKLGYDLNLSGNINFLEKDPYLDLNITSYGDVNCILGKIFKDVDFTTGYLKINTLVQGPFKDLMLFGSIRLENTNVVTSLIDDTLKNLTVFAKLNGSKINIDSIYGEIRTKPIQRKGLIGKLWNKIFGEKYISGNFRGEGDFYTSTDVSPQLRILLFLEDLPLKSSSNGFYFLANADLELTGFPMQLLGDVSIKQGNLLKLSSASPGQSKVPLEVEASISIEELLILTKELEGKITGEIYVITTDSILSFLGELKILSGKYFAFGQTFNMQEGFVSFQEISIIDPEINVLATTNVGEEEIFLEVTGALSQPNINMYSSNPDYTQEDLIKLLIGISGDTVSFSQLSSRTQTLLTNYLQSNIGRFAEQTLGLDEVEIQTSPYFNNFEDNGLINPNELRFTVGKSVSDKLYLRYSHVISDIPRQQFEVKYKLSKNLSIGAMQDEEGKYSLKLDLKWKY